MTLNRRLVLATAILSTFVFLLFILIATYQPIFGGNVPAFLEPLISYHVEFMIATAMLGVAVGASVFYLMQERIEVKQKESKVNAEMLLGFLAAHERMAVEYLIKNKGAAYQSEIGRIEGMTRLKAFRAIEKLEGRGIITVDKNGKARKVILSPAVLDALSI